MKRIMVFLFIAVLVLPSVVAFADDGQNVPDLSATSPNQPLVVNGNIRVSGAIAENSDGRLTQNIVPLTGTLSKLDQLRGVSFEWDHSAASIGNKEGEKSIGMIAQELQKVYPELVVASKNGGHEYLSIDYGKFTVVLLQALKELQSQIDATQDQIQGQIQLTKELESRVSAKQDLINALQEKIKTLEKEKGTKQ